MGPQSNNVKDYGDEGAHACQGLSTMPLGPSDLKEVRNRPMLSTGMDDALG